MIILTIILMYISIKLGNHLIKKFVDRQIKSNAMLSLDSQRAKTLGEVLKSVLKYLVYFLGIGSILSNLFNGMSFTFASIGGVAVGFGAQSLVKDLINGFFILFEDQFGVGDYITIGEFSGIVESIGIRTIVIKDFSGDVHSIPNGSIIQVTNHSRDNIRFIVDVDIAYEENIDNAINVIKKTCEKFEEQNEDIREPIQVLGVNALNASSVTIRVIGKAKPLKQWETERELRKLIKIKLDEDGIEIPYPKTQLINLNLEKERI
ncbi:mechanosensitive ion channel family protein [Clostridium sp. YB-6]|uniref:Mechanosensitive ion channel family protein n=2 Tax=Clostridium weizhouense TaxID=2859781 RepID=A0ABS7ATB5_9CLOT|nr:mechanosensitive ion channel family protein [Clostridium weizhouense]